MAVVAGFIGVDDAVTTTEGAVGETVPSLDTEVVALFVEISNTITTREYLARGDRVPRSARSEGGGGGFERVQSTIIASLVGIAGISVSTQPSTVGTTEGVVGFALFTSIWGPGGIDITPGTINNTITTNRSCTVGTALVGAPPTTSGIDVCVITMIALFVVVGNAITAF